MFHHLVFDLSSYVLFLFLVFCSSILFSTPPSSFLFLYVVFRSSILFSIPPSCLCSNILISVPLTYLVPPCCFLLFILFAVPLFFPPYLVFFSSILFSVPLFCFYPSYFLVLHLVLGTFIYIQFLHLVF